MAVTGSFAQLRIVDFDSSPSGSINAGDSITNQYAAWGLNFYFSESGTSRSGLDLWAFDSGANQNGIDDDLETFGDGSPGAGNSQSDWQNNNYLFGDSTGANNILIIQEKNNDSTPDDDSRGGIINMVFDNPVNFHEVGIVDIDDLGGNRPNSFIRFYDSLDALIGPAYQIAELGNNSYQEISFLKSNVRRVEFELGGSGGVSGLSFTAVPEPSTYGIIGAGFLLGLIMLRRRKVLTKN